MLLCKRRELIPHYPVNAIKISRDYSCYDSLHVDLTSRTARRDAPKARKDFQTRFAGDSTQGESLLVRGFYARH